ncbi:MAG: hypothetical protein LPK07_12465 [Hymenobacteraceae bacterium]|nr:hypothetical protein [Hymenobacteraceae bacterium]MDX5482485.1 hypothetical protein [Hymenobacteraceae bacterium]
MAMYNGSEGEEVSLKEAAAWTRNYRSQQADKAATVKAHFFGQEILQKILSQEKCVGMRMYYGLDGTGGKQLILVGVDADGNDLEDGVIADRSKVCPPDCVESALSN